MEDIVTIPDASAAPEVEPTPAHREEPINWAHRPTVVEKCLELAKKALDHHQNQPERKSFDDIMDSADRMYRCSKTRDATSAQYMATLSNYPSLSFFRRISRLTTEDKAVVLGRDDLPVKFAPIPGSEEYEQEEGERLAQDWNMLLAYTMEMDNARATLGRILWFLNKYGNAVTCCEWDYRTAKRRQRVITERDPETNAPLAFDFREDRVTIADWPTLSMADLKDIWFDAKIDGMEGQRAILRRSRVGIERLWQEQEDGLIKNVDKITLDHLYAGEGISDTQSNREDNASRNYSDEGTGELERWDVLIRVPITDAGKWAPRKVVPNWHWITWIGDLNRNPVCVRLGPNPYFHGRTPYNLVHSHEDDIGALHMGYADILGPNYEEETTTVCQWEDNKTLRNKKPLVVEAGGILTRDLSFSANKVLVKRPGAEDPHFVEVQDTTQTALPHLQWIEEDGDKAVGITKSLNAETVGNRASATADKQGLDQAMKQMLDKAYYVSDQLLRRYAQDVKDLWEQYADPARTLTIIYKGEVREIKPAELHGSMSIRVESVREYENNALRKQEETALANVLMPAWLQVGLKKPVIEMSKVILKGRNIADSETWFDDVGEADSERVAWSENQAILFGGVEDTPQPGENHETHLRLHETAARQYALLPAEEQNQQALQSLRMHIEQHKSLKQSQMPTGGGMAPAALGGETPPTVPGEVAGDLMGAEAGAVANA